MSNLFKGEESGRRILTYVGGVWQEGDVPLFTVMSPGVWLSAMVFDGARAFDGKAPDLGLHCARCIDSAVKLGLTPPLTAQEIEDIAWDGISRFPRDVALYVRPTIWAGDGFVSPDPDSARFALTIFESPLPDPSASFSACISSYRRPTPESAPTEAKASCLYPNVARCLREAASRGFESAIVLDSQGNVAEFATANLFIVNDGVAATPAVNGTFLNGLTRQRVIALLREDGVDVEERRITRADIMTADEIFSTGNHAKVMACTRVEDREFGAGPVGQRARGLYFDWAARQPSPLSNKAA